MKQFPAYFRQLIALLLLLAWLIPGRVQAQCSLAITTDSVKCNGSMDGVIHVTMTGGTGVYTWMLSNNATDTTSNAKFDISGLSAGTYSITVTAAGNCNTSSAGIMVKQPAALTFSLTPTPTTCGLPNGKVTMTGPSGGTPAYKYIWNNGSTTKDISLLPANTYAVTVTDAHGCTSTSTNSASVAASDTISATVTATNVLCNGQNTGTAMVAMPMGGSGTYGYKWAPGNQTTASITGLVAGTYTVTITSPANSTNCSKTYTVAVTEPPSLSATATANSAGCGQSNGTASVTATGGTGAITYKWSNNATTATITGLNAGTYMVTVKDANNCTKVASAVVGGTSNNLVVNFSGQTNVSCFGGSNGQVTASASGGSGSYTYAWSTTPGQSGPTATSLSATIYTVTLTDSNSGCVKTATVTITGPSSALSTTVEAFKNSCPPPAPANGTITVKAQGGTPPYKLAWSSTGSSGSLGFVIPNSPGTYTITDLPQGAYTIVITDSKDCTKTVTTNVGQFNPMNLNLVGSGPFCNSAQIVNNNYSGSINLTVSGGQSPFAYSWTNWPGNNDPEDPTGLQFGTYTVTVTDGNACVNTSSATLSDPAPISAVLGGGGAYCQNSNSSAQLTVNISNGNTNFNIELNPSSANQNNQISPSVFSVNPNQTTTYALTKIVDSKGCVATGSSLTGSATVTVTQTVNVGLSITTSPSQQVCKGTSVKFTAVPSGEGSTPSYKWFKNGFLLSETSPIYVTSDLNNNDKIKCELQSSITCPASGNTVSTEVTMTVYANPEIVTGSFELEGNPSFYCVGEEIKMSARVKNNVGQPLYKITFADDDNWVFETPQNISGNGTGSASRPMSTTAMGGTYTAFVTDSRGCKSDPAALFIDVKSRPETPLTPASLVEDCYIPGNNPAYNTLSAYPQSSGSGNASIRWFRNQNLGSPLYTGQNMPASVYVANPFSNTNPGVNPYVDHDFYARGFFAYSTDKGCYSDDALKVTLRVNALPANPAPLTQTINDCQFVNAQTLLVGVGSGINAVWSLSNQIVEEQSSSYIPVADGLYTIKAKNPVTECFSLSNATINYSRWIDPKSDFDLLDVNQDGIVAGLLDTFVDISVKGSNNMVEWTWDFSNLAATSQFVSSTMQGDSASVRYDLSGIFPVVCLDVKDNKGCINKHCDPQQVDNPNDCRIQYKNIREQCIGIPFTIDVTAKPSSNSTIQNWKWTYLANAAIAVTSPLNGTGNNVAPLELTITSPGTYPFTLEIKDPNCTKTATVNIKVNPKPSLQLLIPPTEACTNDEIKLNIKLLGQKPFNLAYSLTGIAGDIQVINYTDTLLALSTLVDVNKTLVFKTINDKICVNDAPNLSHTIAALPLPGLGIVEDSCFYDEKKYQLTVKPTGINGPFSINGQPVSATQTVTLPKEDNNIAIPVVVTDAKGCVFMQELVRSCDCNDVVPDIALGDIGELYLLDAKEVCEGDSIIIPLASPFPPLGTSNNAYKLKFYLYRTSLSAPVAVADYVEEGFAKFAYPTAGVIFNSSYYVQGVLSKQTPDGKPDFNDCNKRTSRRAVLNFIESPKATVISEKVCAGSVVALDLKFTGTGPFVFDYSINNGQLSGQNVSSIPVFNVPATTSVQAWPIKIDSLKDFFGCKAKVSFDDVLNIQPLPNVTIFNEQAYCKGDSIAIQVQGGDNWIYQWVGLNTQGDRNIKFLANAVGTTTYYLRVQDGNCVAEIPRTIEVKEIPLPDLEKDRSLCQNVVNTEYTFENVGSEIGDYKWEVYNSNGQAMNNIPIYYTKAGDPNNVYAYWNGVLPGVYTMRLTETVPLDNTGRVCSGSDEVTVTILEDSAPDTTDIQLFTAPSTFLIAIADNLCYQWGYTPKNAPGNPQVNPNDRFKVFPVTGFDPVKNYYWVDTWEKINPNSPGCAPYDGDSGVKDYCVTRSYYNPPALVNGVSDPEEDAIRLLLVPNPNRGDFTLFFGAAPIGSAKLRIYDFSGRLMGEQALDIISPEQASRVQLWGLPEGQYVVQILCENGKGLSRKFIIQNP